MTCGFEHLIAVVPPTRRLVADLARETGLDSVALEATLRNGLREVPVAAGEVTSGLAAAAVKKLFAQRPDLQSCVRALILCHSLPMPAPAGVDLLGPCLNAGDLAGLPAVAITGQPCAIMHSAIQTARTWLSGLATGEGVLLVGADVANRSEERLFFNSAMGDAALAGVLVARASRHRVRASVTVTQVRAWLGELSPDEAIAQFRAANIAAIRGTAERCMAAAGIGLDELALVVPHTPNMLLWDAVAALMRLPRQNFLTDHIGETGHLNSNDSFVHYKHAVDDGRLAADDLALLINPGFGGSCGCTLMQV